MNLLGVIYVELCREEMREACVRHMASTYQILHGHLAGFIYALHELQDVVGKTVYDSNPDVIVVLILAERRAIRGSTRREHVVEAYRVGILVDLR